MQTKYEIDLEEANEAIDRVNDAITALMRRDAPFPQNLYGTKINPEHLGRDIGRIKKFLNVRALGLVDEIKSLLD